MSLKSQLMAILNVTPDSFFAGSRCETVEKAITRGISLWQEGADILDIGGESTRPGAEEVAEEEEMARVVPVIKTLNQQISIPISIDTRHPKVAKAALEAGAGIINDVSGFRDEAMRKLAAESGAKLIVMHMLGKPKTMQMTPHYPQGGVITELLDFFTNRIHQLEAAGVNKRQIILDPGIGFGKSVEDNLQIFHHLAKLKSLGLPLLLGLSRKSFMSKILGKQPEELLPATIAMNTICLMSKVEFIRVHDVAEHRGVLDLINRYLESQ